MLIALIVGIIAGFYLRGWYDETDEEEIKEQKPNWLE